MSERIRGLLRELKRALHQLYGERLQGVYLYGSYARGEEDNESDVDVLVVLDKIPSYGSEVDRTSPLVSALALKYAVSISRVFISQEQWGHGQTIFLTNAREEAVPA